MKKILLTLLTGFSISITSGQEISDAVRFAQENLNGTARFRAMSGAFGALGGDLSAINVNPAGSAIYSNNQAGLTLSSYNTQNKSDYFGTHTTDNDYTFDLNQAGFVFVFKNNEEKNDWRKITLSVNYDNANNLDNTAFSAGINPTNSVANYFLGYANQNGGVALSTLQNYYYEELGYADAQAFLGYNAYLINPLADEGSNTAYVTNVPSGTYQQENSFVSTGYNGKLSFNAAASYKDRLYFGLNINSHFTDYRQATSFYEQNANDPTAGVQRLRFNNELYTYGSGFSFQLGTIFKATEALRLGVSYQSPTWYQLNDELQQNISSVWVDADSQQSTTTLVDPNVVMVYDQYKLQTPGKWTGSAAYVFGKSSLISIDYSFKDYGNTQFGPENDFINTNRDLSAALSTASEIRIGAEHRIKQWSIRAGYRMDQSPYKNNDIMGDLNSVSGGLGYNFGHIKTDLSYTYAKRDTQQPFFSQGFTDAPKISSVNNNVSLTVLFEL